MFRGTVSLQATIRGNGLSFERFEFLPSEPGVEKIEMESPKGDEIYSTVHLASVASRDEGKVLAEKVTTAALNRIAFHHGVVIENARMTGHESSPLNPQPGVIETECGEYVFVGDAVRLVLGVPAATMKQQLEQVSPPGEHNYWLLRLARQSASPVEEFMHPYHILLMIVGDEQARVDAFIINGDPSVPQTPDPCYPSTMETIYTRLRNELAHKRAGVDLATTKSETANWLGGLVSLTKRAIELNP
jgi:hypothetical protein